LDGGGEGGGGEGQLLMYDWLPGSWEDSPKTAAIVDPLVARTAQLNESGPSTAITK